MAEETSKEPETEDNFERKFSQEQYDMLKRCSDKKDITEWNEWRKANPDEDVLLESTDLRRFYFKGAMLNASKIIDYKGAIVEVSELNLVDLKGIRFNPTKIRDYSGKVFLQGAYLFAADLESANLVGAHLEGANLCYANLTGANLRIAYLRGVRADNFNLENTNLYFAKLEAACFPRAIVDSSTLLWGCTIDNKTDFSGVSLESMRIQPNTKELLSYNIRRMYWERWYGFNDWDKYPGCKEPRNKVGRILRGSIRVFWWISDYGLSTGRIIFTFFGLAIIFANIYYHWGRIFPPGIVGNLFIDRSGIVIPWQLVPLRTFYFSIVTMTTLGFGDMYAYPSSWFGYILLMVQVILGYVLLGALITRFAVLFNAGGPAGKFADQRKRDSGAGKK